MQHAGPLQAVRHPLPWLLQRALQPLAHLQCGSLLLEMPDGRQMQFQGPRQGPSAFIKIRSYRLARRLAAGDVGLAEGYIQGDWDTPDIVSVLLLLTANQQVVDGGKAKLAWRVMQALTHRLRRNTRSGARRNILAHYDLGNQFYSAWLDTSMTYSSAYRLSRDLMKAQNQKYARLSEIAGVTPGDRILEIGCGWGGYMEYAAKRGAHVTGLTISPSQRDFASQRLTDAGLSTGAEVALRDYRDEYGTYDRIVSIEMFEAVGEAYWRDYFDVLARCLKPGGTAALQIITIDEAFFSRYRSEMDFIRYYIFPGGMLPTRSALLSLGTKAGLELVHEEAFGLDYAETCRQWRAAFSEAWPRISPMGFDEKFRRLWIYYLCYCEAAFLSGIANVRHIGFRKPTT